MSGALVQVVAKGAQDLYIQTNLKNLNYYSRYTQFNNFSNQPVRLQFNNPSPKSRTVIKIDRIADLITYIWLEGTNISDSLHGTTFSLYIGGQLIDTQTYSFMADIWQIYMAETNSKATAINNAISKTDSNFFPLHFWFCDHGMFLPLVALQYYQVELHINWGSTALPSDLKVFGNFVLLDTPERQFISSRKLEFLITQVQKLPSTLTTDGIYNLRTLNHPVKAIFFGFGTPLGAMIDTETWTFDSVEMALNQHDIFTDMSPTYMHTVQTYYNTDYGRVNFLNSTGCPAYTRFFMYSFGNRVNSYDITGTCNFSRISSARMLIKGLNNPTGLTIDFYGVNYNILRVENGMCGLLFSN
jgi:hypothetical protein